eukprot:2020149-Lingulodinium_polyedra.AAC.1
MHDVQSRCANSPPLEASGKHLGATCTRFQHLMPRRLGHRRVILLGGPIVGARRFVRLLDNALDC